MFRGLNTLALDSKGRMSIPARLREKLREASDGCVVITIDVDRCLLIYPQEEWERVEEKLSRLPTTNKDARRLQRLLLGHAEECEIDAQGRVLVSPQLREFAQLGKRVALVGQGRKLELWDEERWLGLREELLGDGDGESLSGALENLVI